MTDIAPAGAAPDATPSGSAIPALDVHTHAMPMPLLQALADRGIADLSGLPQGIAARSQGQWCWTRRDAPLPLAKSMHDVQIIAQTSDELANYVWGAPDRLVGLGSVPLGWSGAAEGARRALDDLGLAGIAIGSQCGGPISTIRLTTISGRCCPTPGRSCGTTPLGCSACRRLHNPLRRDPSMINFPEDLRLQGSPRSSRRLITEVVAGSQGLVGASAAYRGGPARCGPANENQVSRPLTRCMPVFLDEVLPHRQHGPPLG